MKEYKGYEIELNEKGWLEATLDGNLCFEAENYSKLKKEIDKIENKDFKGMKCFWFCGFGTDEIAYGQILSVGEHGFNVREDGTSGWMKENYVYKITPDNLKKAKKITSIQKQIDALEDQQSKTSESLEEIKRKNEDDE